MRQRVHTADSFWMFTHPILAMEKKNQKDKKPTAARSARPNEESPRRRDVLKNTKDAERNLPDTDQNSDPVLAKKQ